MAYMEKDKLDTLCQKLKNTCEENHLSYKLVTRDPIGWAGGQACIGRGS